MSEHPNAQQWEWCDDLVDSDARSPVILKSPESGLDITASKVLSQKRSSVPETEFSTPKTSKVDRKLLHIQGRKLNFESPGHSSVTGNLYITAICCNGTEIKVEVRDLEDPNLTYDADPVTEIHNIVGDVPVNAQNYILTRRASVLPYKCSQCERYCPPLYKCAACGLLMFGAYLHTHEDNCNDNRIQ